MPVWIVLLFSHGPWYNTRVSLLFYIYVLLIVSHYQNVWIFYLFICILEPVFWESILPEKTSYPTFLRRRGACAQNQRRINFFFSHPSGILLKVMVMVIVRVMVRGRVRFSRNSPSNYNTGGTFCQSGMVSQNTGLVFFCFFVCFVLFCYVGLVLFNDGISVKFKTQ